MAIIERVAEMAHCSLVLSFFLGLDGDWLDHTCIKLEGVFMFKLKQGLTFLEGYRPFVSGLGRKFTTMLEQSSCLACFLEIL